MRRILFWEHLPAGYPYMVKSDMTGVYSNHYYPKTEKETLILEGGVVDVGVARVCY